MIKPLLFISTLLCTTFILQATAADNIRFYNYDSGSTILTGSGSQDHNGYYNISVSNLSIDAVNTAVLNVNAQQKTIDELKNKNAALESNIKEISNENSKLKGELDNMKRESDTLKRDIENNKRDYSALKNEISQLSSKIK